MFGYEKGTFTGGMKDGKIGLFEFADRGTVFLDEIGEIKRLGSNQIIKSDVRIIAATNRNLAEMVQEKTFRADLYYRLNVLVVNVPPLRERTEDIRPLAEHFLKAFNKKYGYTKRLGPDTIQVMEQYDWPGNVRELRNTVERMIVESRNTLIELQSFRKVDTVVVERPAPPAVDPSLPYQQPWMNTSASTSPRWWTSAAAICAVRQRGWNCIFPLCTGKWKSWASPSTRKKPRRHKKADTRSGVRFFCRMIYFLAKASTSALAA